MLVAPALLPASRKGSLGSASLRLPPALAAMGLWHGLGESGAGGRLDARLLLGGSRSRRRGPAGWLVVRQQLGGQQVGVVHAGGGCRSLVLKGLLGY